MVHALGMGEPKPDHNPKRYAVHVRPGGTPVAGLVFDLDPSAVHERVKAAAAVHTEAPIKALDCWIAFVLAGVGACV